MKTLLLIDSYGLLYRGHFAMIKRHLTAPDGTVTSGVYYLISEILNHIDKYNPDYIGAIFDYPAKSFRKDIFPEYKANRPPMPDDLKIQANLAREIIPDIGIPLLEKEGMEADDIIADLTAKAIASDTSVMILTSDKDLLQLLGDGVTVLRPNRRSSGSRTVTAADAPEIIGVRADQIVDYLSLMGDSSDNIPGVKGIGTKGAKILLSEYDTLEGIYNNLQNITSESMRKKLEDGRESAELSRKLISLTPPAYHIDKSPAELTMTTANMSKAGNRLSNLGMYNLMERLDIPSGTDLFSSAVKEPPAELNATTTIEIITHSELTSAGIPGDNASQLLAVDTETTSSNPFEAEIVGVSITSSKDSAIYVPLAGKNALPFDSAVLFLNKILKNRKVVAQNASFDIHVLEKIGVSKFKIAGDPMLADYIIRPESHSHSLKKLSMDLLGRTLRPYSDVLGNAETLAQVDTKEVAAYCCADASAAFELNEVLNVALSKDRELQSLYNDLEIPLVQVIADMEKRGIALDTGSLDILKEQFSLEILKLKAEAESIIGANINLNSPSQVSNILFDVLKLNPVRKTRKGKNSSGIEVLSALEGQHRFVDIVLEHRTIAKLLNTYIEKLPRYLCKTDSLIHTNFSQTVTATGRLSSSNPNLQNIPIKTAKGREVRRCFIPPGEGNVLITADYSQIELRVLAHFAGDGRLREAFGRGEDIHSTTSIALFGDATPDNRRRAKTVNFSITYGISAFGLSQRLGISRYDASDMINKYMATYPELLFYIEKCIADAEATEETRTILGRRRSFPGMAKAKGTQRKAMERMAVNTIIQGSAADIIKLAMLKVDERLKKELPNAGLVLQVHDELVLSCPESEVIQATDIMKYEMENAIKLEVPLIVDTGWGENWLEAQH